MEGEGEGAALGMLLKGAGALAYGTHYSLLLDLHCVTCCGAGAQGGLGHAVWQVHPVRIDLECEAHKTVAHPSHTGCWRRAKGGRGPGPRPALG